MYNFEGYRFPLQMHLKIDYYLCEFLKFGFPIGYFGKQLKQIIRLKITKGQRSFQIMYNHFFNKEKKYGVILGLFKENPFSDVITLSPLNTVPK